jgi:adenine-specific DNA-methyltransferase
LKILQNGYKNKVDIIYIDPPYNTTNHKFLYKDNFVKDKNNAHDDWIEFMGKRLDLASALLSDDGVIFISIDENEAAHLKILCDEVFGEMNYITQFVWQKKNKPSFLHKKISTMYELVLCYAKDIDKSPMLSIEKTKKSKPYPLNFKNNSISTLTFKANSVKFNFSNRYVKKCEMSSENIKCFLLDDVEVKDGVNVNEFRLKGSWRYTQSVLDESLKNGCQLRVAKTPFRVNLIKNTTKLKQMRNMLTKDSYNMQTYEDGISQIIDIFGFEAFSRPKPVGLIKTLIKSVTHSKKDALVLDFFAGSGTTAQAVNELNKEDSGARKFILVQSCEKVKQNSEAFRAGYKTIYEITKDRILKSVGDDFIEIAGK